jgi:S1-C subfamily serine protease
MTMDHPNPPNQSRRAGRIATLLTAFALFVSGIGIGWLFTEPAPEEVSETPEEVAASFVEPTTSTTTLPSRDVEVQTDPLVITPGDEPVADVAEALLPSVVQIEVVNNGIERGVGTGVIYDASGLVMTAEHVVAGLEEVRVRLSDGNKVVGQVVGQDANNDIAVIAIDGGPYVPAPLALDDKPRPGSLAIALGSPWGLDSTVTSGIVSAVDRTIVSGQGVPRSMLQTDASINPGNSGGPLVDRSGRVIGINVSIYSTSGANDGVGFAVPIDRAFRVSEALVAGGEFVAGFLGVRLDNTSDLSAGAVVAEVTPDTAAEAAGIRVGDTVLSINDVPVAEPADLGAQVRAFQAGDTVELEIDRNGSVETLVIELGARDDQG